MLKRDDELRLSEKIQNEYGAVGDIFIAKLKITNKVQIQVCKEFGFKDSIEEGLDLLRSAKALFPNDQEVLNSAHYLKYNIVVNCPITLNTTVPNVTLRTPDMNYIDLYSLLGRSTLPTVLLVGSHT